MAASEKAQQLRLAGKLRDARDQLQICARNECPALVRQDCTQWISEVMAISPSVVVGAKDSRGRDLVDVKVTVDGKLAAQTLDGKALPLDPGVHTFRYEHEGAPAVEEQVVVKQGEKNRVVTVTFATPGGPKDETKDQSGAAGNHGSRGAPVGAYVIGGLGIVALGAALVFDLKANSDARDLRDTCAPSCKQDDVDAVQTKYVIAGVALGVGIVAVGIATVMLIARPSDSQASALRFDVKPIARGGEQGGLQGGVAELGWRF